MVLREHEGLSEHEKGLSGHNGSEPARWSERHDKSELVRQFSPMCQNIVDRHFTLTFVFGFQVPNSWAQYLSIWG